jgi:myo-inositol-1(or 4)-monophosphatase
VTGAIVAAEVAEAAARAGGAVLMRSLRDGGDLEIGYKDARANLVTAVDRESQRAVTETILTAFPDHAVDGEEGTAGSPDAANVWYVDPLDGTTNFTHGVPFFCVSVALWSHGRTVAGAIYDPLREEMFVGVLGGGATLNGVPVGVSDIARLDRALLVA